MSPETSDNALEQERTAAPAPNDTQDILLAAHDTVADLVPDAVEPRRTDKPYRDAGGAWRVWR